MSHPFNTFALKMKVHCRDCEKKLKNELQNIKGVRSVEIDQKLGKVIISGKVDPAKILTKLEKVGREAEFWCEQEQSRKDITRSKVIDPLNDPDIMTQLKQFSDLSDEIVEVNKTTTVTFKGESRNGGNKTVEITTITKNVKKHQGQVLTHDHDCSHSGGGLCAASSSCCGGHSAIRHDLHYGCCQYGNNTNLGPCCAHGRNSCYYHRKYGNNCAHNRNSCYNCHCQYGNTSYDSCYANSNSGPIWSNDIIPSAPPMPDDYNYKASPSPSPSPSPPSSARPQPYYSFLSDENVNSCTIL
ncbi:PREDICTED: uncharacterized protein LOC109225550 [Nicotiana attenuata]|uniref:Heavy metal-associated isoprenylated plant protein 20 n=1 Tax=Nicotiana attenuata TaxID=49451 RepID=A0A1J6IF11_NICAT|nr:PREDICTED: uncharacterized protein LOC109225550 [Nicotiana attenuata]OIT03478.1 heavy metal-associated isoprenylated plant protein 20 [Nicotiana attenuata]